MNFNVQAQNSADAFILHKNIEEVDFCRFEDKIDLLSGGPPCQPFSNGGRHHAHRDKRNMFPEAIRAVREIRPKAFIFENVAGLTRPNFRDYFEYIRLQLCHPEVVNYEDEDWPSHLRRLEDTHLSGNRSGLNYRLIVHSLNAADYGVPQQRNRVFFVGFQEQAGIHWHFPEATHSRQALLQDMHFGDYWEKQEVPYSKRIPFQQSPSLDLGICENAQKPWVTLRQAISDLPAPSEKGDPVVADPMHVARRGARTYKGHTGSRLDEPSKTIKAGVHGVPGGENMFTDDMGRLRYFTLRECARIQTFPDKYQFDGSWSSTMKQLGNAVPVTVAELIAKSVFEALNTEGI